MMESPSKSQYNRTQSIDSHNAGRIVMQVRTRTDAFSGLNVAAGKQYNGVR